MTNKNNELLLLRHGKSDWPAGVPDEQRPLRGRGRKNATRMGLWLVEQNLLPDTLLSSPAQRALGTAQKVCDAIGWPYSRIRIDERIYEASAEQLLDVLRELGDEARRVLMVGHNPGLEHLLIHLCPIIDIPEDGKLLPTATLAHLGIDGAWSQLDDDSATLLSITRPRSLAEKFAMQTAQGVEYRERPAHYYTQSAVVPYQLQQQALKILLVTSRKGKRWTLPKGIVDTELGAAASAAREALEEAGVRGELDEQIVGQLRYRKWGAVCQVSVFSMRVTEQLDDSDWPESWRQRRWVSVDQLAEYLDDPSLLDLLRVFYSAQGN